MLQTGGLARRKRERARWVWVHVLVVAVTQAVVLLPLLSLAGARGGGGDRDRPMVWPTSSRSPWSAGVRRPLTYFALDQALHLRPWPWVGGLWRWGLAACGLGTQRLVDPLPVRRPGFDHHRGGGVRLRLQRHGRGLAGRRAAPPLPPGERTRAHRAEETGEPQGRMIGILERMLVLTLVLVGQWGALGLVMAAKSIARFEDLKHRSFSEYYLIGTLASLLVATVSGLLVKLLL